ncbi:MAG: acyl-CoA thioesterase [Fidelibacterota bacterium]|tara:strand:- start:2481 stop:2912 length:432 start_codon:yes stop_codon:yes gene_type:complete
MINLNNIKREDFNFIKSVEARWVDMDALRHINNSVYLSYFESARVEFLDSLGININRWEEDESVILGKMEITYLRQSSYPNIYDIGCRISRLGTKSFDIFSAIFDKKSLTPIVTGTFGTVSFNYKSQQTILIPKAVRDAFEHS